MKLNSNKKMLKEQLQLFLLKKNFLTDKKTQTISFKNIKKVCIIIEKNSSFKREIVVFFRNRNIKVFFITIKGEKEIINKLDYNYTEKDFNFLGLPKKLLKNYLDKSSSDLLINMAKNNTLEIEFLISKINTALKVNVYENKYYDFIFKSKEKIDINYLENLFNYLQKIKR